MTVSTINSVAEFVTNGVTKSFPFYFKFLECKDLVVTYISPEGVSSDLVMGIHYTVTGAGDETGGSVVTTSVLAGPGQLIVSREMEAYQQTSLRNQGKFLAGTHEDVFDRLTMLVQQGFSMFRRALTRPFGRDYFFAENRRITAVKDPVEAQDASTKVWTQSYVGDVVSGMAGNPNLASNVFYRGSDGLPYTVQDMSRPIGAGLVGFDMSSIYFHNTVGSELKSLQGLKVVIVTHYGATGDGVTDDTSAINAAILAAGTGGDVVFPSGTYLITSTIISLTGQRWLGRGGQRAATIKKGSSIDMVVVGSLSTIIDMDLEGDGENYSGKGFRVASGFSHTLTRCRAVNMGGEPLYFDNDAGGGANISTFEGYPTDPTAFAGIAIAGDTNPHPRFFRGIWLSGANFALGPGAGNGGSMVGFYIRNLKLDPGSTLFHFGMGRVAAINDDIPLQGFDHTFDGVAFSGTVILQNAQGINVGSSCTVSTLIQNPATAQYNSVFVQRRSYPVLWTQTSATPAIGSGSLVGNFVRAGHLCLVEVTLTAGSTTTFGDSASGWQFSLPFPGHASIDQRGFPVRIYDASAAVDFTAWATIGSGSQVMTLSVGAQSVRAGQPMVWASGDTIQCSFLYMTR